MKRELSIRPQVPSFDWPGVLQCVISDLFENRP